MYFSNIFSGPQNVLYFFFEEKKFKLYCPKHILEETRNEIQRFQKASDDIRILTQDNVESN